MPRRLAIRLALALLGLVVALVGGLAVLIAATSAPVLPPPPLPTATAQPGPQTTSIVSALALPTATPQPGPLVHLCNKNGYSMLWSSGHFQADKAQHLVYPSYCKDELLAQPGMRSGLGADPNGAVRALIGADPASDIAAATVYRDSAHPRATDPPCDPGGQWSLQVDPENVVGYPYSQPPSAADWDRAATVVDTVTSLCPAPIVLSWYAHDKARPSSDRWTALLPSTPTDGPTLQSYALAHARQL